MGLILTPTKQELFRSVLAGEINAGDLDDATFDEYMEYAMSGADPEATGMSGDPTVSPPSSGPFEAPSWREVGEGIGEIGSRIGQGVSDVWHDPARLIPGYAPARSAVEAVWPTIKGPAGEILGGVTGGANPFDPYLTPYDGYGPDNREGGTIIPSTAPTGKEPAGTHVDPYDEVGLGDPFASPMTRVGSPEADHFPGTDNPNGFTLPPMKTAEVAPETAPVTGPSSPATGGGSAGLSEKAGEAVTKLQQADVDAGGEAVKHRGLGNIAPNARRKVLDFLGHDDESSRHLGAALMRSGAATLAGGSEHWQTNLGRGMPAGIDEYARSKQAGLDEGYEAHKQKMDQEEMEMKRLNHAETRAARREAARDRAEDRADKAADRIRGEADRIRKDRQDRVEGIIKGYTYDEDGNVTGYDPDQAAKYKPKEKWEPLSTLGKTSEDFDERVMQVWNGGAGGMTIEQAKQIVEEQFRMIGDFSRKREED